MARKGRRETVKVRRQKAAAADGPADWPKQAQFAGSQKVRIKRSLEQGTVEGIGVYTDDKTRYFIRYRAADGRARTDWMVASELEADI